MLHRRLGMLVARIVIAALLGGFLFTSVERPALAKAVHGTVTAVTSATAVTLVSGKTQLAVRLVGVDAPQDSAAAQQAAQFVAQMALNKHALARFDHLDPGGEFVSILLVEDPAGIKDVGLELVRAGLVRRQKDYDYKYGELSAAEREAQKAHRGIWK